MHWRRIPRRYLCARALDPSDDIWPICSFSILLIPLGYISMGARCNYLTVIFFSTKSNYEIPIWFMTIKSTVIRLILCKVPVQFLVAKNRTRRHNYGRRYAFTLLGLIGDTRRTKSRSLGGGTTFCRIKVWISQNGRIWQENYEGQHISLQGKRNPTTRARELLRKHESLWSGQLGNIGEVEHCIELVLKSLHFRSQSYQEGPSSANENPNRCAQWWLQMS